MPLITNEVTVKLTSRTIKYYEDKGYLIPRSYDNRGRLRVKQGTTIIVDVNDLLQNSEIIVDIKCDKCNKNYQTTYSTYFNMKKDNNKTYCQKCAVAVYNSGENSFWKNKHFSKEHKNKLSQAKSGKFTGSNNPNWNPNLTNIDREKRRNIPGYTDFIKKVLYRDDYTCQCCKATVDLEIHHLDGYDWYKEKRIDDSNGITLCKQCHSNFHLIYGKGKNTKKQFEEWSNQIIQFDNVNITLPSAKRIYCVEENKIYDNATILANEWGLKNNSQIYDACNHKIIHKTRTLQDGSIKHYSYTKTKVKGKTLQWI